MHITLRALHELVEPTAGKRLPTAKALRESGCEVVASAEVGADGKLTVYQNGFYSYETHIGTTVFGVDRCTGHRHRRTVSMCSSTWINPCSIPMPYSLPTKKDVHQLMHFIGSLMNQHLHQRMNAVVRRDYTSRRLDRQDEMQSDCIGIAFTGTTSPNIFEYLPISCWHDSQPLLYCLKQQRRCGFDP